MKENKNVLVGVLNKPLRIFNDSVYLKNEKRYGALGITNAGRRLAIIFTVRKNMIRIISARDQGKKDRTIYTTIEQKFYAGEKNTIE